MFLIAFTPDASYRVVTLKCASQRGTRNPRRKKEEGKGAKKRKRKKTSFDKGL
jgi:hypothetical protein